MSLRKEFLYGFIIPSILLSTGAVAMDQDQLEKDAAMLAGGSKSSQALQSGVTPLVPVLDPPLVAPTPAAQPPKKVVGGTGSTASIVTPAPTKPSAATSGGGKGGLAPKQKAKKHAHRQEPKDGSGSDEEDQGLGFGAAWTGAVVDDRDDAAAAASGGGMPVLDDEASSSDEEARAKHKKEHRKEKKEHKKERRHSSGSDEEESGFPCVEDDDCASPKKGHRDRSPVRGRKSHESDGLWAMLSGLASGVHPASAAVEHGERPSRGSRAVKPREEKQESPELAKLLEASAQLLEASKKTNTLLEQLIKKLIPPVQSR